jgi:hypothetical protein
MARVMRRAVIHRIAINNRVSLAEAQQIYEGRSDRWKRRACAQEMRRQANEYDRNFSAALASEQRGGENA